MALKGFAEAHNYKGGFEKWVYDTLVALESKGYDDTAIKARIKAVEDDIGEYESESTISERLTALETPAEQSEP